MDGFDRDIFKPNLLSTPHMRNRSVDEEENRNVKRSRTDARSFGDPAEDDEDELEEEEEEDEIVHYEEDYLACRALTQKIKDLVVREIGGDDPKNQRITAECISRGRCSFTKTMNPPPEILRDNPTLKEYQVAAVHWLLALFKNGFNGLLADDMGLGKSAESICFLKRLYEEGLLTKPTIITCPTTLLDNWLNELHRWAPGLKVMRYHGTQAERRQLMRQFELGSDYDEEEEDEAADAGEGEMEGNEEEAAAAAAEDEMMDETANLLEPPNEDVAPLSSAGNSNEPVNVDEVTEYYPLPEGVAYHVLVTSHPTLASLHDRQHFFKIQEFGFLLVDEAHGLKNAASNRYQQINKSVKAPLRLLLTGSPIQNQIGELKNLLEFLNPYRNTETFHIHKALAYHRRVWEQALEKEKEREVLRSTLPTLVADAMSQESPAVSENEKAESNITLDPPPPSVASSVASSKSGSLKSDPEILFYQQLLAPLILRRLKSEVIHNFPIKTSKIELLDMHPDQQALYLKELRRNKTLLSQKALGKKKHQTAMNGLVFRLRRICNHPLLLQYYFNEDERTEFARYLQTKVREYKKFPLERVLQHIEDWSDFDLHNEAYHHLPALQKFRIPQEEFGKSCKVLRLLELVKEKCVEQDEKMLIFSQYTTYLDVIQEVLRLYCPNIEFLRLDGSTAVNERSAMVSSFQDKTSSAKLFLLSTKAGGVGLNLTASNTVVLMDQDWNPHNDRQAEDRVHRLGQTGDVTVYRLCCRHSFEESVLSCCKKKLELDEAFGGVQEALPLEIFEEILRDAQHVIAGQETPTNESDKSTPTPEKKLPKKTSKKVVEVASPKRTVAPTKRTAEKQRTESPAPKRSNSKPSAKKHSKKTSKPEPTKAKHENALLPGGDSD